MPRKRRRRAGPRGLEKVPRARLPQNGARRKRASAAPNLSRLSCVRMAEFRGREPDAPSKDERPRARRAKQGRAIKGFPLALAWRVGLAGPESRLTSWHSEQTTLLLET